MLFGWGDNPWQGVPLVLTSRKKSVPLESALWSTKLAEKLLVETAAVREAEIMKEDCGPEAFFLINCFRIFGKFALRNCCY